MKKLLVAAIGAVAAYGASAGSISEQRFENVQGDLPLSMNISALNTLAGAQTQVGFWSGDEITNTYTAVTASGFPEGKPLGTPTKALEVKTKFGNPLSLNAIDGGSATNIPASGIYFDSLVKFTVCDDVPEQAYDGAKIIMWLQESEVNNQTTTNIMVRAVYVNSDYTCTPTNYVCKTFTGEIEQYHRVTIKTWASIFEGRTVPGFAIFLDNDIVNIASGDAMDETVASSLTEAAGHLGTDQVFPSLVQGNAAGVSTISSVAFDGTGYITDLVFTDEAPFAAAEDYVAPKATVNGTNYPTLEAAVAAVNAISSGDVTFALAKNMTLSGTLAFTSAANVIFDFAGFVLTNNGTTPAISNNGTLVITNSTPDVGGIVCTSTGAAVVSGAEAGQTDIMAGFFDGTITDEGWAVLRVFGGSFKDKTAALAPGKVYKEDANTMGLYDVIDDWSLRLTEVSNTEYTINSLDQLKAFQQGVADGLTTTGVTFKLTTDIALEEAWPGIGIANGKNIYTSADFDKGAFCGTFDGQNHTISGFQMVGAAGNPQDNGKGLDYCGFFNSVYNATIQNLKIAYAGSTFAVDTTASTEESGATFVGVAKNSTLRNLTTVAGTVSCSKGFGGIVGYLTSGTTVDSCTNNVNMTSLANNKCGGIAMIAQGGSAVTIQNCQNNGTQTTGSSNSEYGAIVGYVGLDITIANCETTVGRFLKHQNNTVTLQGVNKGDATVAAYHGAATPGLDFATVDNGVATFVANDALALNGEYKVMATNVTATFAFAEAGTIAFDQALFTPTNYAITAAQGLTLTDATSGTVKTYTATSSSPWPQPSEDTPAAVNTALAEDGFSTGTGVVTNKVQYDALIAYVADKTSATKPTDLTAAQKANAVLCYALQASAIPGTEITQEDITIDALATGDNGAVDLTVAIDGVTVGQSVPAATLAKIVTAKGGTTLNAMSTENVTVSGHAVDTGNVTITVTPNANSPTSFFTSVIINK